MFKRQKLWAFLLCAALLTPTLAGCNTSNVEITTHASTGEIPEATQAVTEIFTEEDDENWGGKEDKTEAATEKPSANTEKVTEKVTESVTQAVVTPLPPEAETTAKDYVCELPDNLNFGKEEVNILFSKSVGREDEMISYSSTMLSQAVLDRNTAVEEHLGVKLSFIANTDQTVGSKLLSDITSGNQEYDIIADGTYRAIGSVIEGLYRDLNRTDYVDTSKDYWAQGYGDMVTFTSQNKQYLVTGDAAISLPRFTYLTIYNKQLWDQYQTTSLYEVVKKGEWTLDYQYTMITDTAQGQDNDPNMSEGDFFGFVTGDTISIDPYVVAADIHLLEKDDARLLYFNTGAESDLSLLCDKVQRLYNSLDAYVYKGQGMDDIGKTNIILKFANRQAIMATTQFYTMEISRNALDSVSYGIAPMPKLSARQERYYSYVQDQVTGFGISLGVTDSRMPMVGATLEAMGYYSHDTVRFAYYDATLATRLMKDEKSYEMLNLIMDSIAFDFSSTCGNITPVSMRDQLRPILSGKTNSIPSQMKSWSRSLSRYLTQTNTKLERLGTM